MKFDFSRLFFVGFFIVARMTRILALLLCFGYLGSMASQECIFFAHRGANKDLPENTLSSITTMIERGVKGIEIDVQFTQDHEVALLHDECLFRTTGIHQKIGDITRKEIEKKKIEICFLEEVLALCKKHGVMCAIEIKEDQDHAIIHKVHEKITQSSMQNLAMIYSFDLGLIKEFSRQNPPYQLHLNLDEDPMPYLSIAEKNGWGLNPGIFVITKEFVEACNLATIPIHVWTVNDEMMMETLKCWKVDAIISDELYR